MSYILMSGNKKEILYLEINGTVDNYQFALTTKVMDRDGYHIRAHVDITADNFCKKLLTVPLGPMLFSYAGR